MSLQKINTAKFLHMALIGALVSMLCSPAMAALPSLPMPTGGGLGGAAVQDGDFFGIFGAYFKAGLTILGLVLAALAFIMVVVGSISRWRLYAQGKLEIADLKEYLIMSIIVMAFVVMMVKYAFETLA
ncbi:DUF2976 domain-containing protein [Comamonas sp.]|uniref:DUF2976 domain-containing protein n=1 Tax=Comamonas sp. TaxID=34028 RepID=UPI00258AE82B|nr:DUF2976 domain-containing protein [Comamonas sp.]